jgi:hypothetical protein
MALRTLSICYMDTHSPVVLDQTTRAMWTWDTQHAVDGLRTNSFRGGRQCKQDTLTSQHTILLPPNAAMIYRPPIHASNPDTPLRQFVNVSEPHPQNNPRSMYLLSPRNHATGIYLFPSDDFRFPTVTLAASTYRRPSPAARHRICVIPPSSSWPLRPPHSSTSHTPINPHHCPAALPTGHRRIHRIGRLYNADPAPRYTRSNERRPLVREPACCRSEIGPLATGTARQSLPLPDSPLMAWRGVAWRDDFSFRNRG